MKVRDLIEKLRELPEEAEIRLTIPLDSERVINQPATDVRFDEIGPLLYVEIV